MSAAVDIVCMHDIIPRATTKTSNQRYTLGNIIEKSKWTSKKYLHNQQ